MGVCFAEQAFNKARRMETRERLNDHMVTYKDWQRILEAVKVSKQQGAGPGRHARRRAVHCSTVPRFCRGGVLRQVCKAALHRARRGGAHTRAITCLFQTQARQLGRCRRVLFCLVYVAPFCCAHVPRIRVPVCMMYMNVVLALVAVCVLLFVVRSTCSPRGRTWWTPATTSRPSSTSRKERSR